MTQRRIVSNGYKFRIEELLPAWWLLWISKRWQVYLHNYTEMPQEFSTAEEAQGKIAELEQTDRENESPYNRVIG